VEEDGLGRHAGFPAFLSGILALRDDLFVRDKCDVAMPPKYCLWCLKWYATRRLVHVGQRCRSCGSKYIPTYGGAQVSKVSTNSEMVSPSGTTWCWRPLLVAFEKLWSRDDIVTLQRVVRGHFCAKCAAECRNCTYYVDTCDGHRVKRMAPPKMRRPWPWDNGACRECMVEETRTCMECGLCDMCSIAPLGFILPGLPASTMVKKTAKCIVSDSLSVYEAYPSKMLELTRRAGAQGCGPILCKQKVTEAHLKRILLLSLLGHESILSQTFQPDERPDTDVEKWSEVGSVSDCSFIAVDIPVKD